jgi:hypothetical protein
MAVPFAMGAARLIPALQAILPKSAGEWALRVGPEAGFAAMSAMMAPEGVSAGQRAGLAAEDMLIGLGTSFLGSGLGRGAGKLMYKSHLPDYAEKLGRATSVGDMAAAPLVMVAPRPVMDSVYGDLAQKQQEEALRQEEERQSWQAAVSPIVSGAGSMLMPGIMPPGSASLLS